GQLLRVEEKRPDGQPAGEASEFLLVDKTVVVPADAALDPGTPVSVKEAPRGLAFVWQRHVVKGEPVNAVAFLLALLLFFAAGIQTIVRWYVLVRATGLSFRLPDALRLGFIGLFFSNFLPSAIGGDVIKAYFIAKEQSRRAIAVATVVID